MQGKGEAETNKAAGITSMERGKVAINIERGFLRLRVRIFPWGTGMTSLMIEKRINTIISMMAGYEGQTKPATIDCHLRLGHRLRPARMEGIATTMIRVAYLARALDGMIDTALALKDADLEHLCNMALEMVAPPEQG